MYILVSVRYKLWNDLVQIIHIIPELLYTYVSQIMMQIIANETEGTYYAVSQNLKAYTFSIMVDLWGDIPFTEFNVPGQTAPSPDSSKDIYNALISILEEGKSNLTADAENSLKPGKDDFFYAGNVAKWVRLNNTIKLKLLLQSRKAKSDITDWQSKLNALVAENAFINKERFQFWLLCDKPADERHPLFSLMVNIPFYQSLFL